MITAGVILGGFETAWETTAGIMTEESASILTWSDTPVTATASIEPVTVADKGDQVGTVTFTAGARTVSVPLALDASIAGPDGNWRFWNPGALLAN